MAILWMVVWTAIFLDRNFGWPYSGRPYFRVENWMVILWMVVWPAIFLDRNSGWPCSGRLFGRS